MASRTPPRVLLALTAVSLAAACEAEKKPEPTQTSKAVETASTPPAPAPAPAPEPSAEQPEEVPAPAWVDDYAAALCKRVAVCREKMLGAVPPEQKMMLSMQIPTQEACIKNTRTFKGKPPKAELDDKEKKALASCIRSVPTTACGNVQTGKVPECEAVIEILAAAKAEPPSP